MTYQGLRWDRQGFRTV